MCRINLQFYQKRKIQIVVVITSHISTGCSRSSEPWVRCSRMVVDKFVAISSSAIDSLAIHRYLSRTGSDGHVLLSKQRRCLEIASKTQAITNLG